MNPPCGAAGAQGAIANTAPAWLPSAVTVGGCGAVCTMVVRAQQWSCSLLAMAGDPLSADQRR
jgi:hypothetical protein